MRAVAGVIWDGELRAVVHQAYRRIWPIGCGVASAAVTVDTDHTTERQLPSLLRGHNGVFQVRLIGDYGLDVNPRVYGSLPLAVKAGVNLPAVACKSAVGRTGGLLRAQPGVEYRWLEGEVRHFLARVGSGDVGAATAIRELRPRRGTAYSVESWRDPRPSVVRLQQAWRRT